MTLTRDQEKQLLENVAAILVALEGNGLGSSEGMIHRVLKLERADEAIAVDIRGLRQQWARVRWVALGVGIGAGGLGGWISTFLPNGTP